MKRLSPVSWPLQEDEALSPIANDPNHTILLDSERHTVLEWLGQDSGVGTKLRVSTAVLRLASSIFLNMFKPSFHQWQRLLNEDCPENDVYLMGLLLRILRYRGSRSDSTTDAEQLARLSLLCDKYDCTETLGPSIPTGFRHSETGWHLIHGLGFLILVAYMFNDRIEFKTIYQRAVLHLTMKFSAEWEKEEPFSIIPFRLIVKLREVRFIMLSLRSSLKKHTSQLVKLW